VFILKKKYRGRTVCPAQQQTLLYVLGKQMHYV